MSGPKVSDYELERRRQEELRRQYLEEQRRIEEHRRQQQGFRELIRRNISRIRSMKSEVLATVQDIKNNKNSHFDVKAFQQLCTETDAVINRCMEVHDSAEISPQAAQTCEKETERMFGLLLQQNEAALDERLTLDSAAFASFMQALRAMTASVSSKPKKNAISQNVEYERMALEVYHKGSTMLANAQADMPERVAQACQMQKRLDAEVKELGGSAQEIFHAAQDYQREIEHQVNLWRKEEQQKQAARARHADLVHRYHYYCNELALERMSVEELNEQSESMLESLCATLDNMLYRRYEENYIFDCINAAMAEIGYELYGRASHGIRGQFLYRMHGDTVIHVACSDQGIISMEVGRASNQQRALEAEEVDGLVEDMHTFCGDYAALQQKLAEMGVKCKGHIELCPPHPDYAMLFDTSEFELCKSVEYEVARQNVQYLDS